MGEVFFYEWEAQLIAFLQNHMNGLLLYLTKFFSLFGNEIVLVAIVGFFYWVWDKKTGRDIGLSVTFALVWGAEIKNMFSRRRPYFDAEGVECFEPYDKEADVYDISAQGFSFPSMHSASSMAVFGSLIKFIRKRILTIVCLIAIVGVGYSRVAVGMHFPTDVLIGWILGITCIFVVPFLERFIRKEWVLYLVLFATAVPGLFFCKSNDYYTALGLMTGIMTGILFEKKYVNFENTRDPLFAVLRLVGGFGIFLALNKLQEIPFSEELLSSASTAEYLIRAVRYAIETFVIIGPYTMLFSKVEKRIELIREQKKNSIS